MGKYFNSLNVWYIIVSVIQYPEDFKSSLDTNYANFSYVLDKSLDWQLQKLN